MKNWFAWASQQLNVAHLGQTPTEAIREELLKQLPKVEGTASEAIDKAFAPYLDKKGKLTLPGD